MQQIDEKLSTHFEAILTKMSLPATSGIIYKVPFCTLADVGRYRLPNTRATQGLAQQLGRKSVRLFLFSMTLFLYVSNILYHLATNGNDYNNNTNLKDFEIILVHLVDMNHMIIYIASKVYKLSGSTYSLEPPDFYHSVLQVCGRSLEVRD